MHNQLEPCVSSDQGNCVQLAVVVIGFLGIPHGVCGRVGRLSGIMGMVVEK